MAYTQIRYIGYQVPTVSWNGSTNSFCKKIHSVDVKNPPALKGDWQSLSTDARSRVQRLIGVILRAQSFISISDHQSVLKVFLAPEFYFRPADSDNPYTMDEYRAIKDVLRKTIINEPKLKHWLVIPGTIMWKLTKEDSGKSDLAIHPESIMTIYFNTSLYIKARNGLGEKESGVIEKAQASAIDGLPIEFSAAEQYPKRYHFYHGVAKIKKHLFKTDGVQCGLEICLEHNNYIRPIRRALYDLENNQGGAPALDLHLLIAGGHGPDLKSIASQKGGYFFRCDGFSLPGGLGAINAAQISGYPINPVPTWDETATVTDKTGALVHELQINAGDALFIPPPVGYADYWMPQKIHVYPVMQLPSRPPLPPSK